MRLAFTLSQGAGEMPSDFASRLARRACRDDLRDFCGDFAPDYQGIVDGDERAVADLASLAGVDARRLQREAFVRVDGSRRFVHKGYEFVRHNLVRERVRICPMCVAEDLERHTYRMSARPHRRSEWVVEAIRTCAAHDIALVDTASEPESGRSHDTSRALADALPRLLRFLDTATSRSPTTFETYARNRIAGSASSAWLDRLPLHATLRLVGVVGAVEVHGPAVTLRDLTDDDRWMCEEVGFQILDRGEVGVRDLLQRLQGKFVVGRAAWGPKAMYGRLYEWLAHENDDVAYEPMRALMLTHASETLPVGPEDELFGRAFAARRLHSVRSASVESGLHPKRLRKLMRERGLAAADTGLSDDRVLVDADAAEMLLADLADTMTLKTAASYLEIPRPLERELLALGYLRPLIQGGTAVLKDHAFVRRGLDEFAETLRSRIDLDILPGERMLAIPQAARMACCSSGKIVGLLFDGLLKKVSANGDHKGFMSVRVDVDEVRSHVAGPEHGGIVLREVERALGTSTAAVVNLIAQGLLVGRTVTNPVMKRKQTVVMPNDLKAFDEAYVMLNALAVSRGLHFRQMKKRLEAAGIRPVLDPTILAVTLYRRSDIP